MAATENKNDDQVAPWLVRKVTEAIAVLEAAEPWAIEEAEKALLTAAGPLAGLKSREADELWKLVGKARESAHRARLATRLTDELTDLEQRFGGNGRSKRDRRNGRPAQPERALPEGKLGRFAGREPSEEDAEAIRTRMRAFEMAAGAGSQSARRSGPVVGTRKPSASSKKT